MTPGTLLFDRNFIYSDGTVGEKILVILNDGEIGKYVVVKTTSKGIHKGNIFGCQSSDRYPNFFLPLHSTCLRKDTWVGLDQFFEFTQQDVLNKVFTQQMHQFGLLPNAILKQLLDCAINCDDITKEQEKILQTTYKSIS